MEETKLLKIVENHSNRLNTLEQKVNDFQCLYYRVDKHSEKLTIHDEKMQLIMKKLLDLHNDLQELASVRQHIMTACAALGGALAGYLIHILPHL